MNESIKREFQAWWHMGTREIFYGWGRWLSGPWFTTRVDKSNGKESACSMEDLDLIPGLGRSPGREPGNTLQYSGLENPHGQRSLAGYSPWVVRVEHDWLNTVTYSMDSGPGRALPWTSESNDLETPWSLVYRKDKRCCCLFCQICCLNYILLHCDSLKTPLRWQESVIHRVCSLKIFSWTGWVLPLIN